MSVPLSWLVLFFFIILAIVFFIIYEVSSKFKWRMRAQELEEERQKLKSQLLSSSNIELQLDEVVDDLKELLTQRQYQIFVHIINGLTSKEIAEKLNVASRTVDSHIEEILIKLDIEKRSQMASALLTMIEKKIGINSLLTE